MVVLVMAMPRACDDDQVPARIAPETSSSSSAIVHFERNDVATDALEPLDAIVDRAWSDEAARVLIVGYANERSSLLENLELADRRARFVADHLLSRGVPRRQMVVAAIEARPQDRAGARCDIELVRPSLHTLAANID